MFHALSASFSIDPSRILCPKPCCQNYRACAPAEVKQRFKVLKEVRAERDLTAEPSHVSLFPTWRPPCLRIKSTPALGPKVYTEYLLPTAWSPEEALWDLYCFSEGVRMLGHPNNAPGRRIHGSEFWGGLAPTPKPKGSMHTICLGPK